MGSSSIRAANTFKWAKIVHLPVLKFDLHMGLEEFRVVMGFDRRGTKLLLLHLSSIEI